MGKWTAIKDGNNYISAGYFKNPARDFPGKTIEEYDDPQQNIFDALKAASVDADVEEFKDINVNLIVDPILKKVVKYLKKQVR